MAYMKLKTTASQHLIEQYVHNNDAIRTPLFSVQPLTIYGTDFRRVASPIKREKKEKRERERKRNPNATHSNENELSDQKAH